MTRGGAPTQHEALRELVDGLNQATERRERARRGTRAFRDAEEIERRYREILLDDELFGRFLSGDPTLEADLPLDLDPNGRRGAPPRATSRLDRGRPRRPLAP